MDTETPSEKDSLVTETEKSTTTISDFATIVTSKKFVALTLVIGLVGLVVLHFS